MSTTKTYRYGDFTFRTYWKPVGHGFEVGLTCNGKSYFVGNFVHKNETTKWWKTFNREIVSFGKKYWCADEFPQAWYCNFLSNHLYKVYYNFLDKVFVAHNRTFKTAYNRDVKKYMNLRKRYTPTERYSFKRAA